MKQSVIYTVLFFLLALLSFSNDGVNDSLIQSARLYVYSNPNITIEKGYELYQLSNDAESKREALILISDGYAAKRDFQLANEKLEEAFNLLEVHGDDLHKLRIQIKFANHYYNMGMLVESLNSLNIVESLMEGMTLNDSTKRYSGLIYLIKGLVYKKKSVCEVAIPLFEKGIKILESIEEHDKMALGNISVAYYNIGKCQLLNNQIREAESSFDLSEKFSLRSEGHILQFYALLGKAETSLKRVEFNKAIEQLQSVVSREDEIVDDHLLLQLYKTFGEAKLGIGDVDSFENYYQRYLILHNKITHQEAELINNAIVLEETIMRERMELQLNKYANVVKIFTIIFLIVLIVLGLYNLRITREFNKNL